ncbi:MAG TPA: YqiA/YcfP family alpha/beta fold hydrolase [Vicinamibacterales bacterium]|nr:YqiA/YcfP family alpha/beta fold hydrolase [Vicinamibacterales bacterium]
MRVFYLHGFGSSVKSSKAAFIASRLAGHGVSLETPDFNEPDFATLTVTRMVQQVCDRLDARVEDPVALVGSSLGGFVAVQTALARPDRVNRLVLLAPALDFAGNRMRDLAVHGLDEWRRTNRLEVFHHGYGRTMAVRYELYTDALRYDALNATLGLPIQVFQGRRDTAVDPDTVRRWAAARPNVEFHELDDDHQLLSSLEHIWVEMRRFLGL